MPMVYMLIIYSAEADWVHRSAEEMLPTLQAHQALEGEMREQGRYRGGGGLAPTAAATTVRFHRGQARVLDGPYAETKEQLGGFYLVEADSQEDAEAWARRIPGLENRAIEVRAVLHFAPQ
jgi:hypothetical protein